MQFRAAPALLLLAACARPAAPAAPVPLPPDPAPAAATTAPATTPTETGPFLVDAGAEPRYQLRYRVPAGTLRTMTMAYDMTMSLPGLGTQVMPTMLFTGTYDVLEVAADGTFKTRTIFDDTDVRARDGADPAVVETLKSSLAGMEQLQMLGTFDERGMVLSQEVDTGTGANPATAQMVQQSADSMRAAMTPLPTEAVGKGARWTSTAQINSSGVKLDATTEFEVLAVTATTMRLRAVQKIVAPRQSMTAGPQAMTVEGTGSGTSDITIDLTTMVADTLVSSTMAMTMTMADASSTAMTMDQQISMQFR